MKTDQSGEAVTSGMKFRTRTKRQGGKCWLVSSNTVVLSLSLDLIWKETISNNKDVVRFIITHTSIKYRKIN